MNVVIVTTTPEATAEPLGPLPDGVRIQHVTWGEPMAENDAVLVIAVSEGLLSRLAERLSRVLQRGPVLRMVQRLSPLDRGARFWHAVRRDGRIPALLASADVLVSGDRDANFACWHLARRVPIATVSGYAAGTKEVLRRTAG